ncbi:hypothetical protein ABW20_dc0102231 [Dactylellina cionopaga]|nr:hypothetical protein ABW20_dc0102231 [Dactylellina cionopaga]
MGRFKSLFAFKRRSLPPFPRARELSISLPVLDPIYLPCFLRDNSNTPPITIHGYSVPARFIPVTGRSALFLDSLSIGEFKRLGQLIINATGVTVDGVGRLGRLSLLPDSDRLIMVAVTELRDIPPESYAMDQLLRLRLLFFLVTRYGVYFRCLSRLYPGELEYLDGWSHRCNPLGVL